MMSRTFERHGNGKDPLDVVLEPLLLGFVDRHNGALPPVIAINPTLADEARGLLVDIGLGEIEVKPVGGCLIGEVWLGVPELEG